MVSYLPGFFSLCRARSRMRQIFPPQSDMEQHTTKKVSGEKRGRPSLSAEETAEQNRLRLSASFRTTMHHGGHGPGALARARRPAHVDEHRRHRVLGARVSPRRRSPYRLLCRGVCVTCLMTDQWQKKGCLQKWKGWFERVRRAMLRGGAHRRRPPRRRAREPGPWWRPTPPGSASVAPWRRRRSPDPRCTPCVLPCSTRTS